METNKKKWSEAELLLPERSEGFRFYLLGFGFGFGFGFWVWVLGLGLGFGGLKRTK